MEQTKLTSYVRVFKALANHRRLSLFNFIADYPNKSVMQLADELDFSYKSTAQHLTKLASAGLITKSPVNNQSIQSVSPFGQKVLTNLSKLIS
ncbi:MAG TPA: winged helix-turn-helix domain-containing protein [Candidatus Saccharimonadales bacterium]